MKMTFLNSIFTRCVELLTPTKMAPKTRNRDDFCQSQNRIIDAIEYSAPQCVYKNSTLKHRGFTKIDVMAFMQSPTSISLYGPSNPSPAAEREYRRAREAKPFVSFILDEYAEQALSKAIEKLLLVDITHEE
ncbi:hypothetical protein GCK32_019635, partial [Trichostrongylus colubriformis]